MFGRKLASSLGFRSSSDKVDKARRSTSSLPDHDHDSSDDDDDEASSHPHADDKHPSHHRGRSLFSRKTPARKQTGYFPNPPQVGRRSPSAEGLRREEAESESEVERDPVVCPSNAFESDSDSEEEDLGPEDEELEKNTEANASNNTPADFLSTEPLVMTFLGEGPNLLPPSDANPSSAPQTAPSLARRQTKTLKNPPLKLVMSRPVFEKNRCTVTLVQGEWEACREKARRQRSYVVASDLSEESLYAIQWAIGTVLRDGDECYIVSVIETDVKFDPEDANPSSSEKKAKIANQKDRQVHASMLSSQATALLERTRLNVKVYCQAVHAKNARHMLVDMIDFFEPTLVIIGTRGLTKIKGMLLGSVSNYLIQKSSSPVMVTRRPLRLTRTVHKKLKHLQRESRVPLSEASIEKESMGGEIPRDEPDEPEDVKERVKEMKISDH